MEAANICSLLNAFKTLGGDKNGLIEAKKVVPLLADKGGMTKQEIEELLENENCYEGENINFIKLCISIFSMKTLFNRVSNDNEKLLQSSRKVNSRTFTRRKGSSSRPSTGTSSGRKSNDTSESVFTVSIKGNIFFSSVLNGLFGNRYMLEINEDSPVELIAKVIDNTGNFTPVPSIEVFVFLENDEPTKTLVTFSTFKNSDGYCLVKTNLKRGKYLLVPVSVNLESNNSLIEACEMPPLADISDDGEVELTLECKAALTSIFNCIDLNGNGLIGKSEFNYFMQYTSGETAIDEWQTVEENFETENEQLTLNGFLALYQMAIETDPGDVINMFQKMGMDNSLTIKNALPFLLTVTAEHTKPSIKPVPISSFDILMEKVFRKTAVEEGHCAKIQNMNDLSLFIHRLPHRVTIVIQNQSHSKVTLRLDCSKSENCISNKKTLDYTVEVPLKTSMIGLHLFPANVNEGWSVDCNEMLI